MDKACQVLDIHRAHIVGNSVGAVLAAETAANFPDRVDKLVLVRCLVWSAFTAPERVASIQGQYDQNWVPVPRTLQNLRDATIFAELKPQVAGSKQPEPGSGRSLGTVTHGITFVLR